MSLGGSRKEKSALDAPETSVQPCQHTDFPLQHALGEAAEQVCSQHSHC